MIDEIRELFQTLIAPRLECIEGHLKALNTRIDAVESKFVAMGSKFEGKLDALDSKFEGKFDAMSTSIGCLDGKLESFRRELSAEIRRVEETLSADSYASKAMSTCVLLPWIAEWNRFAVNFSRRFVQLANSKNLNRDHS
jgi:hypothetical protein